MGTEVPQPIAPADELPPVEAGAPPLPTSEPPSEVNGFGIPPLARWLNRRTETERRALGICLVAGVVHLAFALAMHPAGRSLGPGMHELRAAATHLGVRGGTTSAADWFFPSSLTVLLAAFTRMLGTGGGMAAIELVLGLAAATLPASAYALGKRIGGERIGLFAAVLTSLDALTFTASGYLLPDVLSAAALAAALIAFSTARRGRSFGAGLLLGFAAWGMPHLALVGVALALGLLVRRRLAAAGALALGLLVVVVPVSVLVSQKTGHAAWIAPSVGADLATAVCPVRTLSGSDGINYASPTTAERAARGEREASWRSIRSPAPLVDSAATAGLAASCLRDYPLQSASRLLENLFDGFAGLPTSTVSPWPDWKTPLAFVAFWANLAVSALAVFVLLGFAVRRPESEERWRVALPLLAMFAGLALLGGGPRYRLPFDVVLLTGFALSWTELAPRLGRIVAAFRGWGIWATAEWDTWRRVLVRVVPNRLLVFAGMWAGLDLFGAAPAPGGGDPGGRPNLGNRLIDGFLRWDAHWYWHIIAEGYKNTGEQRDTAFFPLYPLASRAVGWALGGDYYAGALVVSNLCFVVACVLLYKLIALHHSKRVAENALLLMLVYPFSFVFSAMYTESLFLLATVAAFYFGERERWVWAALAAAAAGATRVPGILVLGGLGLLYIEKLHFDLRRIRANILWLGLGLLGTLGHMAFLWWRFGDALAFIRSRGAPGWNYPFIGSLAMLSRLQWGQIITGQIPLTDILHMTALVVGLVACVQCCRTTRWAYGIWGLATLLISTSVWVGLGRYAMVVFPLYIDWALRIRRRSTLQAVATGSTLLMAYLMLLFANWHFIL